MGASRGERDHCAAVISSQQDRSTDPRRREHFRARLHTSAERRTGSGRRTQLSTQCSMWKSSSTQSSPLKPLPAETRFSHSSKWCLTLLHGPFSQLSRIAGMGWRDQPTEAGAMVHTSSGSSCMSVSTARARQRATDLLLLVRCTVGPVRIGRIARVVTVRLGVVRTVVLALIGENGRAEQRRQARRERAERLADSAGLGHGGQHERLRMRTAANRSARSEWRAHRPAHSNCSQELAEGSDVIVQLQAQAISTRPT